MIDQYLALRGRGLIWPASRLIRETARTRRPAYAPLLVRLGVSGMALNQPSIENRSLARIWVATHQMEILFA